MKLIILGLIMIVLLSACTHSQISGSVVDNVNESEKAVINETLEEKEARLAAEKEKAEAERLNAEKKAQEKLIELKKLEKSISSTIEQCSAIEDELNNTFCFAEEGKRLMKNYGVIQQVHPMYSLCGNASNSDLCFFYAAVMLNGPGYCKNVEDKTGCKLISDPLFCNKVINPNQCLLDRAVLLRFISLPAAQKACDDMKRFDKYPDAKKYSCDASMFEERERDSYSFNERFFLMYAFSKLIGFEINETTIEDYARKVAKENEQSQDNQ